MKRAYLIGDTFCIKNALKAAGCKWDPGRKAWYKDFEWDDEAHVAMWVHGRPGIRNRGSYSIELVELNEER